MRIVPQLVVHRLLPWLFIAVLAGCTPGNGDVPAPGFEETIDRGPVTAVLRIDQTEPTIADRLRLELEVTSDEDYTVELPQIAEDEKIGEFRVAGVAELRPVLTEGNRTRRARIWTLEPFLSGEYTIPELTIRFAKEDEPERELVTEPVTLTVRSLLPEDAAEKLELNDITGPVDLPPNLTALWWTLGILIVLGLASAGLWFWLRSRRPPIPPSPPRPADEIALEALAALEAENLPGRGEFKPFYQRLSDIVRRYIEGRYGVHAPGQTTEEFLASQRRGSVLKPTDQEILGAFLKQADLVKFAEHQPSQHDVADSFRICRNFVEQTRQLPETPPAAPSAR